MGIENIEYKGQSYIKAAFKRGRKGIELNIQAVPEIEAFIRDLGQGTTDDVTLYGKDWYTTNPDAPIKVYKIKSLPQNGPMMEYRLDLPGYSLMNDEQVNLSFLRIAGISEPGGVTFGVKGAYSLPYVINLKSAIGRAGRQFVRDYVAPFDIHLMIVG